MLSQASDVVMCYRSSYGTHSIGYVACLTVSWLFQTLSQAFVVIMCYSTHLGVGTIWIWWIYIDITSMNIHEYLCRVCILIYPFTNGTYPFTNATYPYLDMNRDLHIDIYVDIYWSIYCFDFSPSSWHDDLALKWHFTGLSGSQAQMWSCDHFGQKHNCCYY